MNVEVYESDEALAAAAARHVARIVRDAIDARGETCLVAATGASQLQFLLDGQAEVFVADHPKNSAHGRGLQFELWERDEAAFRRRAGVRALLVEEISETHRRERAAWEKHLRGLFAESEPLGELVGPDARRIFRFFAGHGVRFVCPDFN